MNHRLALVTLLALAPCIALATNNTPPTTSTSTSSSEQEQEQHQGQEQEQQQGQQQQQGDYTVTSSYKERAQAPALSAPSVYAGGTCAYGWSAGISLGVGAATGGKSKPDEDCNRRELSRYVAPLNPWLALKVLCTDPIIVQLIADKVVPAEQCDYVPPAPPVAIVEKSNDAPVEQASYATRDELERGLASKVGREEFDRAVKRAVTK